MEELSLCILITKRVYTFTALFPGFLVPGERSPPGGAVAVVQRGGRRQRRGQVRAPGAARRAPRTGRSGGAYAGETWLVETEEVSVLPADVSSSPSGFLPQQRVVIMQLRNWKRGMAGVRSGRPGRLRHWGCLRARQSGLESSCPLCLLLGASPDAAPAPPPTQDLRHFKWGGLVFMRFMQRQG